MDKQELIKLCDEFNAPDREAFAQIIAGTIENGFDKRDLAL